MQTVRAYYYLTKPGIIFSNVIAAFAGFLLASSWNIDLWLLFATLGGVGFIIASACVVNNYLDRHIDAHMVRTKKRATVSGSISPSRIISFAVVLGGVGFGLIFLTNLVTFYMGIVAYIMYVAVYGYFKRTSVHGTLVGSISGALPPVAGYTAVTNQIDVAAVILFIILAAWQMPHFYAISMFRRDDYKKAKIPVLSVVKGMRATKRQIVAYIVVLALVAPLLTVTGYAGTTYLIIAIGAPLTWLFIGYKYRALPDLKWARKMFFNSLWVLLILCFAIATGSMVA
ncbi:protoheme IX farnesyltransferase [Candidatus Saccharibacteria bacterium]|nr:protoheme IX farnesyltransferase [Candidatus Saccharibacteria bacterium]